MDTQGVRVCVDSADHRANFLDGWEYAGAAFDWDAFGFTSTTDITSATIADTVEANGYVYFFAVEIVSGDVQLRITPAGAGNTAGLTNDRLYPLTVTAAVVAQGITIPKDLSVGIWLDTTTLSPSDDGRCE